MSASDSHNDALKASGEVVILFGGDGSEHRVSVASAQNVASLLGRAALWFATRDGRVLEVERDELLLFGRPFETDFTPEPMESWPDLPRALDARAEEAPVFFVALHGGSGEDGTLQTMLESRGLPFTGSGAAASRLAFDKERAREAVRAERLTVAEAIAIADGGASHEQLQSLLERHGKIVVKPMTDGSSHGVRMVSTEPELTAALEAATASNRPHLAEAFISGTELTVGVVETDQSNEPLVALPCSEVRLDEGRTFDFEGKYLGIGTLEITPAEVPTEDSESARAVALAAHRALGCAGYSRTDVILSDRGLGPVFLETNTLPGLTRASFIPQQLEAAGIAMSDFLESQIRLARGRGEREKSAAGEGD